MAKQLWAPWRLEYIAQADEQTGCVFCDAAAGDDEERLVVHRGEHAFVLLNKFPYASGHLMVASYRHVGDFAELTDEEALEVHRLASRVSPRWPESTGPRATTSAGTSAALRARASSTTFICTSSPGGLATPTSCPSSRTSRCCRSTSTRPAGAGRGLAG